LLVAEEDALITSVFGDAVVFEVTAGQVETLIEGKLDMAKKAAALGCREAEAQMRAEATELTQALNAEDSQGIFDSLRDAHELPWIDYAIYVPRRPTVVTARISPICSPVTGRPRARTGRSRRRAGSRRSRSPGRQDDEPPQPPQRLADTGRGRTRPCTQGDDCAG
jgi:hypothetical protein